MPIQAGSRTVLARAIQETECRPGTGSVRPMPWPRGWTCGDKQSQLARSVGPAPSSERWQTKPIVAEEASAWIMD